MSADVLEFYPQKAASQATPATLVEDDPETSERDTLPAELLYRIFCSEDDHLHTLAMEYFLLDCD